MTKTTDELKIRIPDLKTALNCIGTLIENHEFDPHEEKLFREDVRYSFMMLRGSIKTRTPSITVQRKNVEENYNEFWKDIIEKDGEIDKEQLMKELHDFSFLLEQIPFIFMHATGGKMSKVFYTSETVKAVIDEHIQDCIDEALEDEKQAPSITVEELEGMKKKYVSAEYGLACEDTASFNEKAREYNAALQAVIERIK